MVSYTEARSYARTRGGRLLTGDEWSSAASTPGVQASDDLLEWVESPDENNRTVCQRGRSAVRPDNAASRCHVPHGEAAARELKRYSAAPMTGPLP